MLDKFFKRFFKQFKYGEKGFTLIELLVVVAILGILAAIAIPNVGKFIGTGKTQAAATELANVQTAATAAMADVSVGTISTPGTLSSAQDVTVINADASETTTVGAYIQGGYGKLNGTYNVAGDGTVTQLSYP